MKVRIGESEYEIPRLESLPAAVPEVYRTRDGGKADALKVPAYYMNVVGSVEATGLIIGARFGLVVRSDASGKVQVREPHGGYHFVSPTVEDSFNFTLDHPMFPGASRYVWFQDFTDPGIPQGSKDLCVWYGFLR